MKTLNYFATIALLLLGGATTVNAQNQISNIFKSGVTDLNKVANGYLNPAGNSFSAGLGSNWYNTADVHHIGGFDLTIGGSVVMTPQEDQNFDITGLSNLKPSVPGTTQAPTFAGSGSGVGLYLPQPQYLTDGKTENPLWHGGSGQIVSFTTPKGVSKYIPAPTLQLTVGLPIINDVSVRWMPTVKSSGTEVSFWGVGVKHNFKRWIPGFKLLPFDASVLAAYTKLDINYGFSSAITPKDLVTDQSLLTTADLNDNGYVGQGMHINSRAFTTGLIFSKKLIFFTPYVGVGLIKTNYNITMTGPYPILDGLQLDQNNAPKAKINKMVDPINIAGTQTMPNMTVGFRMQFLGILSIHAQYVAQKYPTASAGFGFSFR
jgi:hypothetical protein